MSRRDALAMMGLLLASSCSSIGLSSAPAALAAEPQATFLHTGFGAGPVVFTNAAGQLVEERRYEPFGEPIDARRRSGAGHVIGEPELAARDLNPLNKRTEVVTGWSDHGARWLVPETARWLTPDPPVEGPGARFMFEPWSLHPYQYVDQNPVVYWDPDGREKARHVVSVTTIDLGIFTFSKTTDVDSGKSYTSVGLTTPSLGFSTSVGVVEPYTGKSPSDVIPGWGVGASMTTPLAGPAGGLSANDSGVITAVGVGVGTGGASASATWTEPDIDVREILRHAERESLSPESRALGRAAVDTMSRAAAQLDAYGGERP